MGTSGAIWFIIWMITEITVKAHEAVMIICICFNAGPIYRNTLVIYSQSISMGIGRTVFQTPIPPGNIVTLFSNIFQGSPGLLTGRLIQH